MRSVFCTGVPVVDGGVVLHSWIAAKPSSFSDLGHEVACLHRLNCLARCEDLVVQSPSLSTASMNSSVTRTEWLAF